MSDEVSAQPVNAEEQLDSLASDPSISTTENIKSSVTTNGINDDALTQEHISTTETMETEVALGDSVQPVNESEASNGGEDVSSSTKTGEEAETVAAEEDAESSGKPKRSAEVERLWALVDKNRQDFASWTQLIMVVEKEGVLEGLKEVYDEFLLYYPFCYGYWKKLADFVASNQGNEAAYQVYEEAVVAVGLSIDVWAAFLELYIATEKPNEEIRALFERAINTCGLEFKSDRIWDMYIDWEVKNNQLLNITQIYRRLLAIPTKNYTIHYENAKEHVEKHELWEILSPEDMKALRVRANASLTSNTEGEGEEEDKDAPPGTAGDEVTTTAVDTTAEDDVDSDPQTMSEVVKKAAKDLLLADFELLATHNEKEVKLRWAFEEAIKRPYFHSKPLDSTQLKNWRRYLEFEMANGGEDRAIFLFERCVIACAQYEEFWLKYTTYLESLSRHTDVRNVYTRACRQHLPYKASIHITWAFYEERQGNFDEALAVISNIEMQTTDNMCVLNHKLNLLRRHGDDLNDLFASYIDKKELNADCVKLLTSKYSRYLLKIKGDADKAGEVLKDAITKNPLHEPFYTQLLDVEYQRQPLDEDKVLAVFELVNASSLSSEIKQKFYSRRYEFIDDLGSDVTRLYSLYQELEENMSAASKDKKRAHSATPSDKTVDAKKAKTSMYTNNGTAAAGAYSSQSYHQQQQAANYDSSGQDWNSYYQQQGMDYSQYGAYGQQGYYQQGYGGYTGYDYNTGYY